MRNWVSYHENIGVQRTSKLRKPKLGFPPLIGLSFVQQQQGRFGSFRGWICSQEASESPETNYQSEHIRKTQCRSTSKMFKGHVSFKGPIDYCRVSAMISSFLLLRFHRKISEEEKYMPHDTAGISLYGDSLYGNLYAIPIHHVWNHI